MQYHHYQTRPPEIKKIDQKPYYEKNEVRAPLSKWLHQQNKQKALELHTCFHSIDWYDNSANQFFISRKKLLLHLRRLLNQRTTVPFSSSHLHQRGWEKVAAARALRAGCTWCWEREEGRKVWKRFFHFRQSCLHRPTWEWPAGSAKNAGLIDWMSECLSVYATQ